MFLEVNRALTDFLKDATDGVNAQLDIMTTEGLFDAGDSQPADIDTIVDETRDIEVARRSPPLEASGDDKPSLSVFILEAVPFGAPGISGGSPEVAQSTREVTIQIGIRYYIREPETDEAFRDAYYYARAVAKCIKAFNRNQTARTRNNVVFRQMTDMRFEPLFQEIEDSGLNWYYLLTYTVRDQRP